RGERHRPGQDERGHLGRELEEPREEAVRVHGHARPERQLEDEEYVPPRHHEVPMREGPGPRPLRAEAVDRAERGAPLSERAQRTPPRDRAREPGSRAPPPPGRPPRAGSRGAASRPRPRWPPRCPRGAARRALPPGPRARR